MSKHDNITIILMVGLLLTLIPTLMNSEIDMSYFCYTAVSCFCGYILVEMIIKKTERGETILRINTVALTIIGSYWVAAYLTYVPLSLFIALSVVTWFWFVRNERRMNEAANHLTFIFSSVLIVAVLLMMSDMTRAIVFPLVIVGLALANETIFDGA